MQPPFDGVDGVLKTVVGYLGGTLPNPTYDQICTGVTGHAEAIQIEYDPAKISYEKLLDLFWKNIDPTDGGGQFADRGTQYRTAIFYHSAEQKQQAILSKEKLERSGKFKEKIATEIVPVSVWYPAEGYHQCYYQKNPMHYGMYKTGSGRKRFLEETWE